MANSGNSSAESALTKLGLQPVTKCSLAKFYVPAFGVTAYTGLCLNVMNPNLITRYFKYFKIFNLTFDPFIGLPQLWVSSTIT